jgi:hypothetical protein
MSDVAIVETGTLNAIIETGTLNAIKVTEVAAPPAPDTGGAELAYHSRDRRKKPKQIEKLPLSVTVPVRGTSIQRVTATIPVSGKMSQKLKVSIPVEGTIKHKVSVSADVIGTSIHKFRTTLDVRGTKSTRYLRETLKDVLRMIDEDRI